MKKSEEFFKIERGLKIPIIERTGKWKALSYRMKIGDSVFLPTLSNANSLYLQILRSGFKPTIRRENDGYRVWKTVKGYER